MIGRIKGYDTGKVYTKDPEERVIWVPYTDAFPYRACYSLSDFALPEPVIGDNDLCVSDFEYAGGTISDSAKAEALSCIERLQTEGTHRPDESKIVFSAYLSIAFRECAGLGYLLPYRLVFTQDGVVYFAKYWDYGIVNCFALDPDSVLLKEFKDILARSDAANEEFVFMQMLLNSSGKVVTDPHHLSASR
ncbi:MAG: hypothetical protein II117_07330 [Clostridia bacterium]|nr:hypothetical protein [Clostridia bacterium]